MSLAALLTAWGLSWFLVRSGAGNMVRVPAGFLAGMGDAIWAHRKARDRWYASILLSPFELLTVPHRAMHCAGCTGFWTGIAAGVVVDGSGVVGALTTGFASMGICAIADALLGAAVTYYSREPSNGPT